jgi:hypothetical protein
LGARWGPPPKASLISVGLLPLCFVAGVLSSVAFEPFLTPHLLRTHLLPPLKRPGWGESKKKKIKIIKKKRKKIKYIINIFFFFFVKKFSYFFSSLCSHYSPYILSFPYPLPLFPLLSEEIIKKSFSSPCSLHASCRRKK